MVGLQTANEMDTAMARVAGITGDGATVYVQEEISRDKERYHIAETVGYWAFDTGQWFGAESPDGSRSSKAGEFASVEPSSDFEPKSDPVSALGTLAAEFEGWQDPGDGRDEDSKLIKLIASNASALARPTALSDLDLAHSKAVHGTATQDRDSFFDANEKRDSSSGKESTSLDEFFTRVRAQSI